MLEFFECFFYVIVHGNVNIPVFIVPPKVHTTIRCAGPVNSTFVIGFDSSDEVLCVVFIEVFHAKIIDAEGKRCLYVLMLPNSWGIMRRCLPVW